MENNNKNNEEIRFDSFNSNQGDSIPKEENIQGKYTNNQNGVNIQNNQSVGNNKNGVAIAGFICALCGIISCGLTCIIGLILSIIGLIKSKKMNDEGKTLAISGIVISLVLILSSVLLLVFTYNKALSIATHTKDKAEEIINNQIDNTKKNEPKTYELGDTFEFDEFEIIIGKDYTFDVINNNYSEYNNQTVVKIPITVKNVSTITGSLNTFYLKVFGPKGTEVKTLGSYFDESIDMAGDLKSNAMYTKYLYFKYDGNGKYSIEFDNYNDEISVEFDIIK